jgi:peptidoglycan/LPS O-acetylase OafA/YrhL
MLTPAGINSPSTVLDSTAQPYASPARLKNRHIPALDGLRGIAILLVLAHHFRFILTSPLTLERRTFQIFDGGWSGVNLFFVLSGFLITGILLDSKADQGYLRTFYARRLLRIFPLYYVYLVLVFVFARIWWKSHFHTDPWAALNPWWYVLYLENFKSQHMFGDQFLSHLWSLAIEEQFYLIWPFLVLLFTRASLGFACAVGFAVALISRIMLAGNTLESSFFANTLTFASLDSLCAGAFIAILARNPTLARRVRPWMAACALLGTAVFILCARAGGTLFLYSFPMQSWGVSAFSTAAACLIYFITLNSTSILSRALSLSFFRSVGRVSYGMYVLHPVVVAFLAPRIHFMHQSGPPLGQYVGKLCFIATLSLATYMSALLSWIALEKPFISLKSRFRYSRRSVGMEMAVSDAG